MWESIRAFIRERTDYQRVKSATVINHGVAHANQMQKPTELITNKVTGPLHVTTEGNKYTLYVVDKCAKCVLLVPNSSKNCTN